MTRENMIMIGAIAVILIAWFVIRALVKTAVNKGSDAIHNAVVRAREEKNPPKAESLADRYNQTTDTDSEE